MQSIFKKSLSKEKNK